MKEEQPDDPSITGSAPLGFHDRNNDTRKHSDYLTSLQAFRGIAALGVVVYHAGLFTERQAKQVLFGGAWHLGELGVDFFFVLSGFIIAFVHGGELGKPEHAPRYIRRRFFRVYPLLAIVTTLKLALELVAWLRGGAATDISRITASYLLLPAPDGQMPVVTAAWTLTHEMLFYALFLLAMLLGRRAAVWIFGIWMALVAIISGAGVSLQGMPRLIFDAHNVEFICGVWACYAFRRANQGQTPLLHTGIASLATLAAGAWLYNPEGGMEQTLLVRLLLGIGFAKLILLAGLWERSKQGTPWPKWSLTLGDASYSIYLGHSLILLVGVEAGRRFLPPAPWSAYVAAGLSCAAALFFCSLLWTWVERPLLRWSRQWCR
ncbi:MAG: acyltransferase family protein [Roseimicrobium sp.]